MNSRLTAGQSRVHRIAEDGMLTTVTHLGRGLYEAAVRLEGWGEAAGTHVRQTHGYENAVRAANNPLPAPVSPGACRRLPRTRHLLAPPTWGRMPRTKDTRNR